MKRDKIPMVSVCVMVWNQSKYILECLKSIAAQKCSFQFEVVIRDDASTDNSVAVINEFILKNHLSNFTLYSAEKNEGMMQNFFKIFQLCKGDYIAFCEADDYWTDNLKLEKQLEFLENNEDYGLIYSKAKVFDDKKGRFEKHITGDAFIGNELLLSNPIPTLTTMFRKNLYQRYLLEVKPEEKNWEMGDYPVWLWFQFNSKIYFMPDITATYRLLTESASHSSNVNKKYKFKLNSFNVSDYYVKRYCTDDAYEVFLEYRYFFLYLFCLRYNIPDKNEYIKLLKKQKKINCSTKLKITIFYDLKFEYAFILLIQNQIFRLLLKNCGARVISVFGH